MAGIILPMPHKQMSVFRVDCDGEIDPSPQSSSVGILYPGERIDLLDWKAGSYNSQSLFGITLDKEQVNP
jgi:hypothetical protein